MGQVPDAHVLLIEDLVLFVVGDEVVLDEVVVDDSGFYGFRIPFDLSFEFKLVAHVRLHILKNINLKWFKRGFGVLGFWGFGGATQKGWMIKETKTYCLEVVVAASACMGTWAGVSPLDR